MIAPQGADRAADLLGQIKAAPGTILPELARSPLLMLAGQLDTLAVRIHALEVELLAWHRRHEASQRLAIIPGVGLITATALAASVGDPTQFRSGCAFAAFLGWPRDRTRRAARSG